ncbi:RNA 2',3'-cyclic phosphodiesterase [Gymnodinialimonas hymeniacidonis]|uniref:RNA 2',3'-cyclic phosphodiesterase n=1 Tax=Gymnodinialimonas hymeniacidonis TaxID=3126508 RepID=UPI0034C69F73
MRSFVALPMEEVAVARLIEAQADLPFGKPVPEENLHLTLAYLGEVSETVLETLHDLLGSARLPAPEITFGALGTFAEMERGLVFAEVHPNEALTALHAKVAQCARQAGADLPRRRFRPHVTLMRANRQPVGPARDRLAAVIGQPCAIPSYTARRMCLYQSTLTPHGAVHEVLADYPLG